MRAIITLHLYILNPLFETKKRLFKGLSTLPLYVDEISSFWHYVLVQRPS